MVQQQFSNVTWLIGFHSTDSLSPPIKAAGDLSLEAVPEVTTTQPPFQTPPPEIHQRRTSLVTPLPVRGVYPIESPPPTDNIPHSDLLSGHLAPFDDRDLNGADVARHSEAFPEHPAPHFYTKEAEVIFALLLYCPDSSNKNKPPRKISKYRREGLVCYYLLVFHNCGLNCGNPRIPVSTSGNSLLNTATEGLRLLASICNNIMVGIWAEEREGAESRSNDARVAGMTYAVGCDPVAVSVTEQKNCSRICAAAMFFLQLLLLQTWNYGWEGVRRTDNRNKSWVTAICFRSKRYRKVLSNTEQFADQL